LRLQLQLPLYSGFSCPYGKSPENSLRLDVRCPDRDKRTVPGFNGKVKLSLK